MPQYTYPSYVVPASWEDALLQNDYAGLEAKSPEEAALCRKFLADLASQGIELSGIEGDGETIDVFPSSDFAVQGLPYQSGMAITCIGRKELSQA